MLHKEKMSKKLVNNFPGIEGPLYLTHCGHLHLGIADKGLVLQHYSSIFTMLQ
jgi:hypothetical protein